jgi:hypothetical protein
LETPFGENGEDDSSYNKEDESDDEDIEFEEIPEEKCENKTCMYWDDGCVLDQSSKCIYFCEDGVK